MTTMKKLLYILLFATLSVQAVAQQDTTKLTTKYVYNDLKQGFKDMVDKLEGPAKHTYAVYVTQYKMDGIFSLIGEGTGFIIIIITFLSAYKRANFSDTATTKQGIAAVATVVSGIVAFIIFGFLISDFSGNMKEIINPEFYAIDKIVNTLRGQ
jgi:hypothetical protein